MPRDSRSQIPDSRLWTYPAELAEALGRFGLSPKPWTPPLLVRDALNDLYRYELRRMRDELRAGKVPKADYIALVIATRKRYWPLTLQPPAWEEICGGKATTPHRPVRKR